MSEQERSGRVTSRRIRVEPARRGEYSIVHPEKGRMDVSYLEYDWSNEIDISLTTGYTVAGIRNSKLILISNGNYAFSWTKYFTGYYPNGPYAYLTINNGNTVLDTINFMTHFDRTLYQWVPENWTGYYNAGDYVAVTEAWLDFPVTGWHL